jgi:glucose-1-phosphate adenylyltransferase
MRDVIAMVLAGGRVEELSVLTALRPKAAVPFGGQFRIIDFALSGLMRADLERVGVLSLYRPFSLIDHLGSGEAWDFIGRGRGIKILPPYVSETDRRWYRGTADAVWQNLNFITDHAPRDVLVLSGDHIFDLDFQALIQQHRRCGADMTMAVKELDPSLGSGRFGFAEVDANDRVIGYQEKPELPRSRLASLTVYLFRTEVLVARLQENVQTAKTHQLYSEVLPAMVARDRVCAYRHAGYWNYPRSVDEYHQAHMDMLGPAPRLQLDGWSVRTRALLRGLGDMPPTRFDSSARCVDSVVCAGAHLSGEVIGSVLSPGVRVEAGAQVRDSVLLPNTIVRAGARLDRVVTDKGVEIGAGAVVGDGPVRGPNRILPAALTSGVSLIGKDSQVPEGAWVGRNCVVQPELLASQWDRAELACGECVGCVEGGEP